MIDIFSQFSQEAQTWGALTAAGGVIALARRYMPNKRISRGSARWMELHEAAMATHGPLTDISAGVGLFRSKDFLGNPGFMIGDWPNTMSPIFYRGPSNILTCAAPGAAKGAGVLVPNALGHNFLCMVDFGGEATAICINKWRSEGWSVNLFNPSEKHNKAPYNLSSGSLNFMDRLHPGAESFIDDALKMAVDIMGDRPESAVARNFYDRALSWYHGFIVYIMVAGNPDERNFGYLRDLVRLGPGLQAFAVGMIKEGLPKVVIDAGNDILMGYTKFGPSKDGPDVMTTESLGVINTMETATKWVDSDQMRRSTTKSTIRLEDLKGYDADGKKLKGAVFVIIIPPEYKKSHAAVIRLCIRSALETLIKGSPARKKVMMMIDEFPAMGKMIEVVEALSEVRKYNIRINLIIQSIAQTRLLYGEDGWKMIEGSTPVKQFFYTLGLDTAEYVSRMCGDRTIVEKIGAQEHLISRPLITPDEVRRLPEGQQIVFIGRNRPVKLAVRPYWDRPGMRMEVNGNPYQGGKTPLPNPVKLSVRFLSGLGMRLIAGVLGPAVLIAVAALAVMIGVDQ